MDLLRNFGSVKSASTVWQTIPVGFQDQPNYLNAVVEFVTQLSANEIHKDVIQSIEKELGRERTENKYGP